jgi:predicted PhzF superfamily epimerase YddE/YHI9
MKIPIYQVNAFSSKVFCGNPAAVCLLDTWIDDTLLQSIATEYNVSETAFIVQTGDSFDIRWFTPTTEVTLCGHGTLASSFVMFECRKWANDTIKFRTRKSGELLVMKKGDLVEMDFPSRPVYPCIPPAGLIESLNVTPVGVFGSEEDFMVVLGNESAVQDVEPDFDALHRIECRGTIITARGDKSDFVSRFFAPRIGVREDPVTGSAHCVLTPYWASVLGKDILHAFQVSNRGGELFCANLGERVKISGRAVLYLEGVITI